MPIRINLKELFAADSQDVTIDKVNFNFNKLLELGIGEQGVRGLSGIQGAAGPGGIPGPPGVRGATWFLDDATDPNDLTFQDLLPGDFYLDSINFGVWQWDGTQWGFVFDLSNIINNYLQDSPSPFVRGFGDDGVANDRPKDLRFIMFNNRDADGDNGLNGSIENDILFLNNFDESLIKQAASGFNSPQYQLIDSGNTTTNDWFNSLLAVYADHRTSSLGRYHLELGVLYNASGTPVLTKTLENLKLRLIKLSGTEYDPYYNIALFSLDRPESESDSARTTSAAFEFRSPVRHESPSSVNYRTSTYMGSKYVFDELIGTQDANLADGILFQSTIGNSEYAANIGITVNYTLPNFPTNTGYVNNNDPDYFMLHSTEGLAAIYLNDKVLQNGGNIVQVGTTEPRQAYLENAPLTASADFYGAMGIAVDGDSIYTVAGEVATADSNFLSNNSTKWGYFNKFSIENPNHPVSEASQKREGVVDFVSVPTYNGYTNMSAITPIGSGVSDIDIVGDYAYVVNNQCTALHNNSGALISPPIRKRTYFQILNLTGQDNAGMTRISRLGYGETSGSTSTTDPPTYDDPLELNCAWRVKVRGRHAIVATNGIHTRTASSLGGVSGFSPVGAGYNGSLTAVDISDPTAPTIVASQNPDAELDVTAILDMKIVDNMAYALVWEQALPLSGTTTSYRVRMHAFYLGGLDDSSAIIDWYGKSSTPIVSGNNVSSPDLPNYGAIEANNTFIFVGYEDTVHTYKRNPSDAAGTSPNFYYNYTEVYQFTLDFTGLPNQGARTIYDMHQMGNSLYVLASDADDFNLLDGDRSYNYYIFKLDISKMSKSAEESYEMTQIWVKELPGACTRFAIVGKHIYASVITEQSTDINKPSLVAIDFDGIYTSGAHIESLRADQFHTTRDATIGGRLVVNAGAEIGSGALINGQLGVAGNATFSENVEIIGNTEIDGDLTVAGNASIGSNLTLGGDIIATGSSAGWIEITTPPNNFPFYLNSGITSNPFVLGELINTSLVQSKFRFRYKVIGYTVFWKLSAWGVKITPLIDYANDANLYRTGITFKFNELVTANNIPPILDRPIDVTSLTGVYRSSNVQNNSIRNATGLAGDGNANFLGHGEIVLRNGEAGYPTAYESRIGQVPAYTAPFQVKCGGGDFFIYQCGAKLVHNRYPLYNQTLEYDGDATPQSVVGGGGGSYNIPKGSSVSSLTTQGRYDSVDPGYVMGVTNAQNYSTAHPPGGLNGNTTGSDTPSGAGGFFPTTVHSNSTKRKFWWQDGDATMSDADLPYYIDISVSGQYEMDPNP